MDRLKRAVYQVYALIVSHLHSNMDRLKLKSVFESGVGDSNLHSNMDRLKPWNARYPASMMSIYIPIWID